MFFFLSVDTRNIIEGAHSTKPLIVYHSNINEMNIVGRRNNRKHYHKYKLHAFISPFWYVSVCVANFFLHAFVCISLCGATRPGHERR